MILNALIALALVILNWILILFPASSGFPTEVHTAFSTIGGYFGMFDGILPLSTLGTTVGIVFTVEIAIFGFKTFKWIASHIPWIGGKGN